MVIAQFWHTHKRFIASVYCFTKLRNSATELQSIATAPALKPGLIFCLLLASISPTKLKQGSTTAAGVGKQKHYATTSKNKNPCGGFALHVFLIVDTCATHRLTLLLQPQVSTAFDMVGGKILFIILYEYTIKFAPHTTLKHVAQVAQIAIHSTEQTETLKPQHLLNRKYSELLGILGVLVLHQFGNYGKCLEIFGSEWVTNPVCTE